MGKASRSKRARPPSRNSGRGCVYYVHTEQGYVGMVASREQAQSMDKHSVLICDENETAQFPQWGNERANQYVLDKALAMGFSRIGDTPFFERTEKGSGYVYFIEAVGLSRVKIGFSEDPESRLRQLLTGSPVTLKIFAKMPGSQIMEKKSIAASSTSKSKMSGFTSLTKSNLMSKRTASNPPLQRDASPASRLRAPELARYAIGSEGRG